MALDDDIEGLEADVGLSIPNPFALFMGRRGRRGGRGRGGQRFSPFAPQANRYTYPAYGDQGRFGQLMPDIPGVPARQGSIQPAAWPIFTFVAGTGTNTLTQTMNPQAPMRGRRPVFTIIRSGASALVTEPLITTLQVGMVPVILTPDGVPASNYVANAFDTNLLLPGTNPGVVYALSMRLPVALAGADTILVIATLQGSSIS